MSYLYFIAGLFVGLVLGVGLVLFYMRWKMRKQIGMMEEQMGDLMESTAGLAEDFDMEDIEEVEEVENEKDQ